VLYLRANTIPEPGSPVLFAGGLFGLAAPRGAGKAESSRRLPMRVRSL
jgi:hypothetical protein